MCIMSLHLVFSQSGWLSCEAIRAPEDPVVFIGDGVYQLKRGHSPEKILQKHYQPLFKMLAMYDVEQVYVCKESLMQRNLKVEDLLIEVTLLDEQQLQDKLPDQDQLLSF